MKFPTIYGKSFKIPWFQTTNQYIIIIIPLLTISSPYHHQIITIINHIPWFQSPPVPVTWSINPWSINAGDVYHPRLGMYVGAPLPISWSTIQTSSGQSYKLNISVIIARPYIWVSLNIWNTHRWPL